MNNFYQADPYKINNKLRLSDIYRVLIDFLNKSKKKGTIFPENRVLSISFLDILLEVQFYSLTVMCEIFEFEDYDNLFEIKFTTVNPEDDIYDEDKQKKICEIEFTVECIINFWMLINECPNYPFGIEFKTMRLILSEMMDYFHDPNGPLNIEVQLLQLNGPNPVQVRKVTFTVQQSRKGDFSFSLCSADNGKVVYDPDFETLCEMTKILYTTLYWMYNRGLL